ncbi:hypothetical protein [Rhodopirellula bahusiensis]|uniref:hypothetical protein n=1 Tax=Rhodopirellula bahusiensis TaxID=2014065 RepID=UPI003267E6E1
MNRNLPQCDRPTIDELLAAASGLWLSILVAAGLPERYLDGKGHPCIKCGGRDRFAAWRDVDDRGAVHCRRCFTRGTDPKPGDGLASIRWAMDINTADACEWLADQLGITGTSAKQAEPRPVVRSIRLEPSPSVAPDSFSDLAGRCFSLMRPDWWERLADRLNLPAAVLIRLRVGWFAEQNATTWPMVDATGTVIGIRLRCCP